MDSHGYLEQNAFQAFASGILKVFWIFASYGSWSISKIFKCLGNLWATGILALAATGNATFRPDLPLRALFGYSMGSFSAVFG